MPSNSDASPARAPRNRTTLVDVSETEALRSGIVGKNGVEDLDRSSIVCADAFAVLPKLSTQSFDLLFADPPYNLTKRFGTEKFKSTTSDGYEEWLDSWLSLCVPLLKKTASI